MTSILSPVNERESEIRIGQSIRCKDCGAHLPWSKAHKHYCRKGNKSPLRIQAPEQPRVNRLNSNIRRPSMQNPTWQNSKIPNERLALDVGKLLAYQEREIDEINRASTLESRISWSNSSDDGFYAKIPTTDDLKQDSLKPSWSWAEKEYNMDRKVSMPVRKAQLDEDIIQALNNRSNSVPEMTAAGKVAQLRRKKSVDLAAQKKMFETMLSDLDKLMEKVDQPSEIPPATLQNPLIQSSKNQTLQTSAVGDPRRPRRRPRIDAGFLRE